MPDTPNIDRLLDMLHFLRTDPDGCPWTKAQTHKSLIPYLIEESYETAETIDEGRIDQDLCDELGDLLLQVVFHAEIASGRDAFTFDDVAKAMCEKIIRRYPTIYGDEEQTLKTPEDIDKRWEEVKAEERKAKGLDPETASVLDGISHALPALVRAQKIKGRCSKAAGWEWSDSAKVLDKIIEETTELRVELDKAERDKDRIADEIGDVLFIIADLARWSGVDAEDALRRANNRVENRFRHVERGLREMGKDQHTSTAAERSALWQEAKDLEKKS